MAFKKQSLYSFCHILYLQILVMAAFILPAPRNGVYLSPCPNSEKYLLHGLRKVTEAHDNYEFLIIFKCILTLPKSVKKKKKSE